MGLTNFRRSELRDISTEQVRCLGEAAIVFRCLTADGAAIGCSVCFVWQDTLYARVAGFDYPRLLNAFEYFNTIYYEPIRYLTANGLQRLHLGTGSLDAKVRRGATLGGRWAAVVPIESPAVHP